LKKKGNKGSKIKNILFFNKWLPFHFTFNFSPLTFSLFANIQTKFFLAESRSKSMPRFFLDSENPKKKRENQINHQAQSSINVM
jgi:hypothetical protein